MKGQKFPEIFVANHSRMIVVFEKSEYKGADANVGV